MKKILLSLLLVTAIGLAASLYMTQSHYRIAQTGFLEKSFCNINQVIDCDTVLASSYARSGPLYNAEWGTLYYLFAFFALLFIWARGANKNSSTLAFLFVSSFFAVLYSIVMAYLSWAKVHALCLFCMVTYAVNLLLFLLLWRASGVGFHIFSCLKRYLKSLTQPGDFKPYLWQHLLVVGIVAGIGVLFFRGLAPAAHVKRPEIPKEQYIKFYQSIPQKEVQLPGPRPSHGAADSKVVLLEFSDFQCPFCRRAAFSLTPFLGELRDKVKIVFMNYPLDQACNPKITHNFHNVSCLAAKGAICADQAGKFWEYHDLVFENQPKLSRALLIDLAKQVGLQEEEFNHCLVSPEVDARIAEDLAVGDQLGVSGTPAVFINGRPFRDWLHPERLQMVIQSELQ